MSRQFLNIQGEVKRKEQVFDLTLTETRYQPGLRLPPHAHKKACIGLPLQGEFMERYGVKTLLCGQHKVMFRPPQVIHSDDVCETGAVCFYVEVSPCWLEHMPEHGSVLREPAIHIGGDLERMAKRLYHEWQDMDDVSPLVIEGIALEMIAQFYRIFQTKLEPCPPKWLRQVYDLLRYHFTKPLCLSEISAVVDRHPTHVAREFRRYYRITIGEFVRRQRINFACERLLNSESPLVEIALEAGFAHQAHFTAVFKSSTGLTPNQYRQLTRNSCPSPKRANS